MCMFELPAWMQVLESSARMVLPIVAVVAAVVGYLSYRQRRLADNRAEWWRRVSRAIELCATAEDQIGRNTGMTLMNHLLTDPTTTQGDAEMLAEVVDSLIDEIVARP
jgi:hypothetical protein